MTKTAIVTGATGYIGQNIVNEFFCLGWNVICIVRDLDKARLIQWSKNPDFIVYDGTYESLINCKRVFSHETIAIHLASITAYECPGEQISRMVDANFTFGCHLLEAMQQWGVTKFINTGSYWQYSTTGKYSPVCFYAATKQAFEAIIQHYSRSRGLKCDNLILYDVYGPNDPRQKLIQSLVDSLGAEKPLELSPGEQKLKLVYISDVISAFILAAEQMISNKDHAYHMRHYAIRSDTEMTLKIIIDIFNKVFSSKLNINWGGRGYRKNEVMDPWIPQEENRLRGWEEKVSLEQGLAILKGDNHKKE